MYAFRVTITAPNDYCNGPHATVWGNSKEEAARAADSLIGEGKWRELLQVY